MEAIDESLFTGFSVKSARLLRESVLKTLELGMHECILHPLGFYFIRLAARGNATIRLHYWPASIREKGAAITPYHDHVWSLCSCILAGAVENVLLEIDSDADGEYQIADINQVGNVDEVLPASSRVRIRIQSSETYRVDEFYEIAPRVFHYTNVHLDEAAITVVQAKVVVDGGPRTLMPTGSIVYSPSRNPIIDSGRIMFEIGELLSKESGRSEAVG